MGQVADAILRGTELQQRSTGMFIDQINKYSEDKLKRMQLDQSQQQIDQQNRQLDISQQNADTNVANVDISRGYLSVAEERNKIEREKMQMEMSQVLAEAKRAAVAGTPIGKNLTYYAQTLIGGKNDEFSGIATQIDELQKKNPEMFMQELNEYNKLLAIIVSDKTTYKDLQEIEENDLTVFSTYSPFRRLGYTLIQSAKKEDSWWSVGWDNSGNYYTKEGTPKNERVKTFKKMGIIANVAGSGN